MAGNMTPIIITGPLCQEDRESILEKQIPLYWVDDEKSIIQPGDYTEEYLKEMIECYGYDYAFDTGYSGHNVRGNKGKLQRVLGSLLEKNSLSYLTNYTEDELFDEVANDWGDLCDFLFYGDVKVENLKKAYKLAQEDKDLQEIITALIGKPVTKLSFKGYYEDEVAEGFVMLNSGKVMSEDECDFATELFKAYFYGCYSRISILTKDKMVAAEGVILYYYPPEVKGKTWNEYEAYIKQSFLKELNIEPTLIKGVAKPYVTIDYEFEENQ